MSSVPARETVVVFVFFRRGPIPCPSRHPITRSNRTPTDVFFRRTEQERRSRIFKETDRKTERDLFYEKRGRKKNKKSDIYRERRETPDSVGGARKDARAAAADGGRPFTSAAVPNTDEYSAFATSALPLAISS